MYQRAPWPCFPFPGQQPQQPTRLEQNLSARCKLHQLQQVLAAATILDEYRKHIEKDPALEGRFRQVKVPEPSVDETIQILQGLRERYEIHRKLHYTDEALIATAQLSY